jgi:hypothetical protein
VAIELDSSAPVYRFYAHVELPQWRLVLRDDRPVPARVSLEEWAASLERSGPDTNPDIRRSVDEHGYCLFGTGRTLAELAAECESAGAPPDAGAPAPVAGKSSGPYRFHVHRRIPEWRLVLREGLTPAGVRLDDWRFTRARSELDTSADTRSEIGARGYLLFRIGYTLEDLAAALRVSRRGWPWTVLVSMANAISSLHQVGSRR